MTFDKINYTGQNTSKPQPIIGGANLFKANFFFINVNKLEFESTCISKII